MHRRVVFGDSLKNFTIMLKACRVSLVAAMLSVAANGGGRVYTDTPGWTFTDVETPTFTATSSISTVYWTASDWKGRPIKVGTWPRDGKLALPTLPPGFYRVNCSNATGDAPAPFDFCIVSADRCRNPNSYFAADAAISGCSRRGSYECPWYDGDCPRVTAELLGKCGIVHTRERLEWGPFIEPKKGKRDFSRYLHTAKWMKANGVVSTGLFHDCPRWLRNPRTDTLPADLMELYGFMKEAAHAFDEYYDAWEFWNEQELGSSGAPVWEYVAALKAFALGVRAGSPTMVILPGSLSGIVHGGYGQVMFNSDIAKYVQAFNLHTYVPMRSYDSWHRDVKKFLEEAGVPDWQVWLTESSTALDGNGEVDCYRKGLKRHSPSQEMLMVEFYPKSNILHQFGGIYRNWYFLFGCYNEQGGKRDWGSMRRDGTVKPIHAAMSALTHELGDAVLLGEMKKMSAGVRAFLYRCKDGTQTVALWSVSNLETGAGPTVSIDSECRRTVSIPASRGRYRIVDVMGTPSEVESDGAKLTIAATRFPQYVSGLSGLSADVPPIPAGTLGSYTERPDEDLSVVLRPLIDRNDFGVTGGKCIAELCSDTGAFDMEVWNFSGTQKTGMVSVSAGRLDNAPSEIVLPPWGKADVRLTYVPPTGGDLNFKFDFIGTFNGRRISKVRIPVFNRARFLKSCETVEMPQLNHPEAWKRNDSGNSYAAVYDEKEKSVRFEAKWDGSKGAWFFPIHMFGGGESFKGAKYVEFEVKSWQDKVENDMILTTVMCLYPDGNVKESPYSPPGFEWERRRVKLPEDADQAVGFRVGGLPKGQHLKYWIRNFRVLKAR